MAPGIALIAKRRFRVNIFYVNAGNALGSVQSPMQKYSCFQETQISGISAAVRSQDKGRFAIVTNAGPGCGGRGSVGRARKSQGGLLSVSDGPSTRTTNGADAYGKIVWSWHLDAGVKSRGGFCRAQPGRTRPSIRGATAAKEPDRRGEYDISRKAIACGNAG